MDKVENPVGIARRVPGLIGLALTLSIAPAIAHLFGPTPKGWPWVLAWMLVALPQLIWCGFESRHQAAQRANTSIRQCGLSSAQGIAALAVILLATWKTANRAAIPNTWICLITLAVISIGIAVRLRAIRDLGEGFRDDIDLSPGHRLHVTGIYQKMRHPSEFGLLLILGGTAILAGSFLAGLVFLLASLPLSVWRSRREDQLLIDEFAEPAQRYQKTTPAWSVKLPVMAWIDRIKSYLKNLCQNIRRPLDLLIAISVLSAAIWYAEVWLRGWAGLDWISYFHLALPAGLTMFLFWVTHQADFRGPIRPYLFLAGIAGFSGVSYLLIRWGIYSHYGSAWAGLMVPESLSPSLRWLVMNSIYFTVTLIPPAFWLISRLFGIRLRLRNLALGLSLYLLAIPSAILVLHLIPHPGHADALHALKTGFCIPLLMIGLGLPFCYRGEQQIAPASKLGDYL